MSHAFLGDSSLGFARNPLAPPAVGASAVSTRRRILLVAGSVVAVAAAWLSAPASPAGVEPDLVVLVRGMAIIKAALAAAALALVYWRLGRSASTALTVGYSACVWLLAAGAVLVWQLSIVPFAAVAFHSGELAGLLLAWREWRTTPRARAVDG